MSATQRGAERIPVVRELALAGLKPGEIVARTGYDRVYVVNTIKRLREKGVPVPVHNLRHGLSAPPAKYLDGDVLLAFHNEARRRGLQSSELVSDLLTTIARDGLFGAVLDTD